MTLKNNSDSNLDDGRLGVDVMIERLQMMTKEERKDLDNPETRNQMKWHLKKLVDGMLEDTYKWSMPDMKFYLKKKRDPQIKKNLMVFQLYAKTEWWYDGKIDGKWGKNSNKAFDNYQNNDEKQEKKKLSTKVEKNEPKEQLDNLKSEVVEDIVSTVNQKEAIHDTKTTEIADVDAVVQKDLMDSINYEVIDKVDLWLDKNIILSNKAQTILETKYYDFEMPWDTTFNVSDFKRVVAMLMMSDTFYKENMGQNMRVWKKLTHFRDAVPGIIIDNADDQIMDQAIAILDRMENKYLEDDMGGIPENIPDMDTEDLWEAVLSDLDILNKLEKK